MPAAEALRSETPATQILSHDTNRHLNPKQLPHQLLYSPSRPQCKRELQLIGIFICSLLQPRFLFKSQRSTTADFSTAFMPLNSFSAIGFVGRIPVAGICRVETNNCAYFFVSSTCLAKLNCLVALLLLRLWFKLACVCLFHNSCYSIHYYILVVIIARLIIS
jgi:hypothetical protein